MSATDELCRLLTEAGVEYERNPWSCGAAVWWRDSSGTMWRSHDNEEDELLSFYAYNSVTPEQVIAATLGRGTCKVDVLNTGDCAGYECSEYIMHCNGCGHEFGHVLYNEDGDVWMSEPPRFCPGCGRRLVRL